MKTEIFTIPIYDAPVVITIVDAEDEQNEVLGDGVFGSVQLREDFVIQVSLLQTISPSQLVHEVTHIVDKVWLRIGYTPSLSEDEPQAYLAQYLYDTINTFLSNESQQE